MPSKTSSLARSITWKGSKQTYFTARLLVDRDLVDDFYRAYAYFRWSDDIVDAPGRAESERIAFIKSQRELLNVLYAGESQGGLSPEETLLAELISHDRGYGTTRPMITGGGLRSFIENMFAIIEFDAFRKGRLINREELDWYSDSLGRSVTDGIQYFIANGHPYPESADRLLAARAAHIAHLLRDIRPDTADGFYNIPREYIEENGIEPSQWDSPAYRDWVKLRVDESRVDFRRGKHYLDSLDVLRCKLAGYLYCARFEDVLDKIERDGYSIRSDYRGPGSRLSSLMSMSLVMVKVCLGHLTRRRRNLR